MKNQTVYLLPGRNDTFDDPPGNMIARMGYTICGRKILADFARLHMAFAGPAPGDNPGGNKGAS